jgi:hypothetical protein
MFSIANFGRKNLSVPVSAAGIAMALPAERNYQTRVTAGFAPVAAMADTCLATVRAVFDVCEMVQLRVARRTP